MPRGRYSTERYIPSLFLSLVSLLPLCLIPSLFLLVSAVSFLLFFSAGIKDALATRSPQKQKCKNKLQLFIYLFFTYSSCLCLLAYIIHGVTGRSGDPRSLEAIPQSEGSLNVLLFEFLGSCNGWVVLYRRSFQKTI